MRSAEYHLLIYLFNQLSQWANFNLVSNIFAKNWTHFTYYNFLFCVYFCLYYGFPRAAFGPGITCLNIAFPHSFLGVYWMFRTLDLLRISSFLDTISIINDISIDMVLLTEICFAYFFSFNTCHA